MIFLTDTPNPNWQWDIFLSWLLLISNQSNESNPAKTDLRSELKKQDKNLLDSTAAFKLLKAFKKGIEGQPVAVQAQVLEDIVKEVAVYTDRVVLKIYGASKGWRCFGQGFVPHSEWCGRRDLNPHALRHTALNRTCLPIPALPQFLVMGTYFHPLPKQMSRRAF